MVYNSIMKNNEQNVIIYDVLSQEEIDNIYSILQNPFAKSVMKEYGQSISDFELPIEVAKKVIFYSEKISGETNLEIAEYQFARYKKVVHEESGETLIPNLTPHWDGAFAEPRFTFDYQLGGNTDWPLVVEEKELTLRNNSALTFSGTHQIHWRAKKEFSENEYIDMIFFHLRKLGSQPMPEDHSQKMNAKIEKYNKIYAASN